MNEGDGKLRRRAKAWKWALGVFGGIALVFGLIFWDAHRRATAVFERHAREVAEKIAAIRSRPSARPPLFGEPIPGNGWLFYTKALDVLGELPKAEADEVTELRADVTGFTPDPAKLEAMLAKYAPQIEDLHRLARASEFVPDYAYEEGAAMLASYPARSLKSAKFLAGMAEHLHQTGRDRKALELLSFGLAMSHDSGRRGSLVNHLVLIVGELLVAVKWKLVLGGHDLTAADLERFAGLLDRIEASRPHIAEVWEAEDAFVRKTLLDQNERSMGLSLQPSWRHLFSDRLMRAEVLNAVARLHAGVALVEALPPWERSEAARRQKFEPGVIKSLRYHDRAYEREAAALATLVLTRVATAIAWHEAEKGFAPAKLEDLVPCYVRAISLCPYTGTPLSYDGKGKVWSIGGDGDDDGGKPLANEDDIKSDGDVVWTVKRR